MFSFYFETSILSCIFSIKLCPYSFYSHFRLYYQDNYEQCEYSCLENVPSLSACMLFSHIQFPGFAVKSSHILCGHYDINGGKEGKQQHRDLCLQTEGQVLLCKTIRPCRENSQLMIMEHMNMTSLTGHFMWHRVNYEYKQYTIQ